MDRSQSRRLRPEMEYFLERRAVCLSHAENLVHAGRLLPGLLGGSDPQNARNMAEGLNGVVRTLQTYILPVAWDDYAVCGKLRNQVAETLGEERTVICLDETGGPRRGPSPWGGGSMRDLGWQSPDGQ